MSFFKKQNYDKLTVEVIVDVTKEYINVSEGEGEFPMFTKTSDSLLRNLFIS